MKGGPKLRWKGVIQGIETKHKIEELVAGKLDAPTKNRGNAEEGLFTGCNYLSVY